MGQPGRALLAPPSIPYRVARGIVGLRLVQWCVRSVKAALVVASVMVSGCTDPAQWSFAGPTTDRKSPSEPPDRGLLRRLSDDARPDLADRPHVPIPYVGTAEHEKELEEMRRMEER